MKRLLILLKNDGLFRLGCVLTILAVILLWSLVLERGVLAAFSSWDLLTLPLAFLVGWGIGRLAQP